MILIAIIMGLFVAWQFSLMLDVMADTGLWAVQTATVLCVILAVFYLWA